MLFLLISLGLVILDQLSKSWVLKNLVETREIIPGFFNLTKVYNKGAAWGFLDDKAWGIHFLTFTSILSSFFILYLFYKADSNWARLAFAFILGGAVGNLIDRLRFSYVVDFLGFKFGSYQFPFFNIADSAIVIGVIILIGLVIFDHQALDSLFHFSKEAKVEKV